WVPESREFLGGKQKRPRSRPMPARVKRRESRRAELSEGAGHLAQLGEGEHFLLRRSGDLQPDLGPEQESADFIGRSLQVLLAIVLPAGGRGCVPETVFGSAFESSQADP